MRPLELSTQRLRLVIPDPAEAPVAVEYYLRNREHLHPTDPPAPKDFHTKEFWQQRLQKAVEEFEKDQAVRLFLESKDHIGKFIGSVTFTQIARGPFQACYLGYSIDREFQGKGLMFEALETGVRYMFSEKHIHRIMANYLPENARSARVLDRLGFRTDGSTPDYLYICGAWRGHVLRSLTNPHWRPRQEDRDYFGQL